jgi:hypothetical protein
MDFEVYCDESGLEALTRKDAHQFAAIGGIWMPAEHRPVFKDAMNALKQKHEVHGELKWNKVSPAYFELYKDVIELFFDSGYIRFRVIVIESSKVDHIKFNYDDSELGFYKFYYQLLHHWIFDFNSYSIFLDHKVNRNKGRLSELRRVLDNSNLTSEIRFVQGLHSDQSVGIQMADILTGLVAARFNGEVKAGGAKSQLIQHIEENHLGRQIVPTSKWEEKFNVFRINLKGGW